ncbi:PDDEXK nuclease domain-containing protein [Desulfonatronum thioautotrophicum]|uniref:PDDEXK nuclease domain-containing protein n=1 Tax=Desulfonatronum thioautotrophicum TaxID=617001 RepID=UPI0009FBB797|nr:PDDEXK nuclease domain-containing protein [Desulfonatronum thioautotrophicum]
MSGIVSSGHKIGQVIQSDAGLVADVRSMIEQTRETIARTVNAEMTLLYWRIGKRIQTEVLGSQRAEYGKEIVHALSAQLTREFGRGFGRRNLFNMIRFADVFPDPQIVLALSAQLGWTHFRTIIPLKDELAREFYAEMCRVERWSTRTLIKKIDSMLYERTAISKKPEEVAKAEFAALRSDDQLTPDLVFRDPYVLDFLGLKDRYLEKDLEDAILREMETFLLELGNGFAFLGRQARIQIDSDDFYIDLLFYHRRLKRLIAIDLKLGDFKAEYKGQMELYLRWLAKHEQQPDEESPLGIILCAGKKEEQIELLALDQSGIHVAEYLTALPPRDLLKQKLHAAIEISRARLESKAAISLSMTQRGATEAPKYKQKEGGE